MQSIDLPQLVKELNGIAEVFDKKPVTEKASKVWFDSLREFPTERVLGLLIGWPKTHGKFPTPSEVWKACNDLSIVERENKARLEARLDVAWERSEKGAEFLEQMKRTLKKPKRDPVEHWKHVMETTEPGTIGYEYARAALKRAKPEREEQIPF